MRSEGLGYPPHEFRGFGDTPPSDKAGGEPSLAWSHDDRSALCERLDVALDGGMLPHVGVHRGGEHERRARGEGDNADGVVREPEGQFRDEVRGRGGDDQHVGGFRKGDVLDGLRRVDVEEVHEDRAVGDAAERERRDEMGSGVGHQHVDGCACLRQFAGEVGPPCRRRCCR